MSWDGPDTELQHWPAILILVPVGLATPYGPGLALGLVHAAYSMHGMGTCPDKQLPEMESANVTDAGNMVEWKSLAPHPAPK